MAAQDMSQSRVKASFPLKIPSSAFPRNERVLYPEKCLQKNGALIKHLFMARLRQVYVPLAQEKNPIIKTKYIPFHFNARLDRAIIAKAALPKLKREVL